MKKKNNQATSYFAYKDDDFDLVELGQFIRDTKNYRVEREWHLIFMQDGLNVGYHKTIPEGSCYHTRNPDLILISKKNKQLVLIIELDGDIHRIKELDTTERNAEYVKAKIPLLVINKWQIDTNIFDHVTKKLEEMGL